MMAVSCPLFKEVLACLEVQLFLGSAGGQIIDAGEFSLKLFQVFGFQVPINDQFIRVYK
jgi:hypothetical protein